MSQQTTVVHDCTHSEHQVVEGSVVPPNIFLNNCPDVHIGPKYVHTNNITINHGMACVGDSDSVDDDVNVFRSVIHKCIRIPYGVHLKIVLFGSSCLLTILIIVIVTLLKKRGQAQALPQLPEDSEDYPLDKRFVSRDAWEAAPPCVVLANNTVPLVRVIFIHTVSSGTCNTFASCKRVVLDIQDMHRNECADGPVSVGDIGYNFVIGSDGHIFVGRGWDKTGAHTYGRNTGSIGVGFVGDFRRDEPSPAMLNSAKTLLEVGVERGKLIEDYQLFGHCQVHSGFPYSPGINMLRKIESWSHWNDTNTNNCANFVPLAVGDAHSHF